MRYIKRRSRVVHASFTRTGTAPPPNDRPLLDAYGSIVIENSRPIGTRAHDSATREVCQKNPSPKPCTNSRIVAYDTETRKAAARYNSGSADTCISRLHLAIGILEISVPRRERKRRKKKNREKNIRQRECFADFSAAIGIHLVFFFFFFFLLFFSYVSCTYISQNAAVTVFFSHRQLIIGYTGDLATRNVSLQRPHISVMASSTSFALD